MIPTQGMVLAAGLGKRMRPLTDTMPKPLIEVAGRSLVDRAIDRLEEAGVQKLVVNTSYKAEMLESHLRKRSSHIIFSREAEPLETGGGIAQALHYFGDNPFFAVNGDVIWLDGKGSTLRRLAEHWQEGLDVLLLLHPVKTATGYDGKGDFLLVNDIPVRRAAESTAPYVYAGVQVIHPRLFKGCPHGAFSLNLLYDKALAAGRLKALVHEGKWLHVGDVQGLKQAEEILLPAA